MPSILADTDLTRQVPILPYVRIGDPMLIGKLLISSVPASASMILVTYDPVGMPVPVTVMPTCMPVMVDTVNIFELVLAIDVSLEISSEIFTSYFMVESDGSLETVCAANVPTK